MDIGIFAMYYESFKAKSIRVYSRVTTAHGVGSIPKGIKAELKKLGFSWDKSNHSYCLESPTDEIISEVERLVPVHRK